MKIAVISDIHSNLYALDAVLKDIAGKGINNNIYCAGDLVGYGPHPNQVIELIKNNGIPTVMGNYDDAIGNMRLICGCDYKDDESLRLGERSIAWTRDNTTETNRLWIKKLPPEIRFSNSGLKILLVHGSPRALNEYIYQDTNEDYLDILICESKADVLVCGHTHLPFVKRTAEGYIVNAGSVGRPKHGNTNATYVLLAPGRVGLKAEVIEVTYDYEKTAKDIEESDLPNEFAWNIRNGCVL